jgi:hypothetical protein
VAAAVRYIARGILANNELVRQICPTNQPGIQTYQTHGSNSLQANWISLVNDIGMGLVGLTGLEKGLQVPLFSLKALTLPRGYGFCYCADLDAIDC